MQKIARNIVLLSISLLLTACGARTGEGTVLQGRVLLWHSWSGTEAEVLDDLLERFHEIYPGIRVISAPYPEDELQAQFMDKVTQGLGPDLLIGQQLWIPELAEAELIQPISEDDIDVGSYLTTALSTLHYKEQLFGLPLSVQTSALYYNKKLVNEPPKTLEALIEEAENGKKVALNTDFAAAFWGVQAFGGRLFDQEGRVVLDRGGFTNWLDWLSDAQNVPNIILSNDQETIEALFEEGQVAYYVDSSTELLRLQETLGEEAIGVAPLPAGPNAPAGPFLETEPLFLNTASSPVQMKRALLLAEFLTNVEQQRRLAQQTGRIPANPRVRIDRRVSPAVAGFVEQSKTAVPLLLIPQTFDVIEYGQEAYVQTLEGLVDSVESAQRLTEQVNTNYGFELVQIGPEVTCPPASAESASSTAAPIEIWHAWSAHESDALAQLAADFAERCPGNRVVLRTLDPLNLVGKYEDAVRAGEGPDMLLTSNRFVTQLASNTLVRELDELVNADFLQRYIPAVPDAMRYGENLYGLPISMDTMALYYNADMVSEPPVDLGDLLNQVGPERQIVMPYTPYHKAHWGISAFGGKLFNVEGELALSDGGFAEWLSWLQTARDRTGIILTRDQVAAQTLFAQGEAAYLVGEREVLSELQAQMGTDSVRVAPLPAGPEGSSGPILDVEGFVLNPTLAAERAAQAIAFAQFAAQVESQILLMQEANLVPANINVGTSATHPAVAGFHKQAKTSVIAPNRVEMEAILGLGGVIYESVLERNADPDMVLHDFSLFVQDTYGTALDGATGEAELVCQEAGELVLWHSESGLQAQVLDTIVAGFARECPDVTVEAVFVPSEELPNRLAAASQAALSGDDSAKASAAGTEAPPDLFLAPHDLIQPLSAERLLKPVTPWVATPTLIPLLPEAVDALRYADALYGLPYTIDTMALYYNANLVSDGDVNMDAIGDGTLLDLFSAASAETPFALDTSFEGAFWGVLAFGRSALEESALQDDAGDLQLEQTGLVDWLSWLQDAQQRQGIIMSDDPDKLQELFAAGNAAYLVAGPSALGPLRSELETGDRLSATVNVTPLPAGPDGEASPFLQVNAFLFSAAVNEDQTRLALKFAEFASAADNQTHIVQEANLVPANVLASLRVGDPDIDSFLAQAKRSVPLPPRPEAELLFEEGNALYKSVLQEGQDPARAVDEFINYVAEAAQPAVIAYAGENVLACTDGRLRFWYGWPFAPGTTAEAALSTLLEGFHEHCPGVDVEIAYAAPDEIAAALDMGDGPDLFLGPHYLTAPLAQSELIQPISPWIEQSVVDAYLPRTIQALSYAGELYGMPQTMDVEALYYNTELVSNPASTLDELLTGVESDTPAVLDSSFAGAYWGVSAFGGRLFDASGQLITEQAAYVDWLTWLSDAREHPGIVLSADQETRWNLFSRGDAAYLIAGPAALAPLRARLGNKVRVIPLPSGPGGPAGPLLRVDAFLFNATLDQPQLELALAFAGYLSSQANQTRLRREANLVPTNRSAAETTDDSAITTFIRQATETSVLLPGAHEMQMLTSGDRIYDQMLTGELDPVTAVNQLLEIVVVDEDVTQIDPQTDSVALDADAGS